MIDFNFEYYKPNTIEEAVNLFEDLNLKDKQPLYYSGGTEIITMARRNDIFTKAIIDIKEIPECNVLGVYNNKFIIGASCTLTQVSEAKLFPLLSKNSTFPADHTARNKITFCGNLCGKIIYKEAILTPLAAEGEVVIAGKKGRRIIAINEAFNEKLLLEKGEFLVQVMIDKDYADFPYVAVKKTKQGKTGYPLVSMVAIKKDNQIRTAFSGVYSFPFRSLDMEQYLNDKSRSIEFRVREAVNHLPKPMVDTIQGSAEYRKFVFENTLLEALISLEGGRR